MGNPSFFIDGVPSQTLSPLHERFFSEEMLYSFVEESSVKFNLSETAKALPLMKKFHEGQTRKGDEHVPYIQHPLIMACHALSLGITDDNIIAAMLLHDVCEDCDVTPSELPLNSTVQMLVDFLTFKILPGETKEQAHDRYFKRISTDPTASFIKTIDRCNNISTMAAAFTPDHMVCYINETEKYVLPLFDLLNNCENGKYKNVSLIVKYHLLSVLESLKHILAMSMENNT